MTPTRGLAEVATDVYRVGSTEVNAYLVVEGDAITVVDAGMPRHWRGVVDALGGLGRHPRDVEALVLTHAHVDHVGFARRLRQASGAPVAVHEADATAETRKRPPLRLYLDPRSWPFLATGLRDGLLFTPGVPRGAQQPFAHGALLEVPGRLRVLHTPGHTAGSCVLHIPDRGVLFTGDALVTLDPYTRGRGPRLLRDGVNEDPQEARASLRQLAGLSADVLLPGHGEPWTGGVDAAVSAARQA